MKKGAARVVFRPVRPFFCHFFYFVESIEDKPAALESRQSGEQEGAVQQDKEDKPGYKEERGVCAGKHFTKNSFEFYREQW